MKIFVYGTLKRSHYNSYLLKNSKFLGVARTCHKYYMLSGSFPVVLKNPKSAYVMGEVYEIDDDTLRRLDQLESNGTMYNREEIKVRYRGPKNGYRKDRVAETVSMYIGAARFWVNRFIPEYEHSTVYDWKKQVRYANEV